MLKKIICLVIPIFTAIITVIFLNIFFNKNIETMLKSKELAEINNEYGSVYKDKGVVYNNYISQNNYPILQASSELNIQIPELPTNFFPIEGMDHLVTQGKTGSQDITQISILGSQKEYGGDRKIAMIVSLQWFYSKAGITQKAFQGNFAPIQFYDFLENEKISHENKRKYAYRVDSLLAGSDQFYPEKLYAKLYASDSKVYKLIACILRPYFSARKNIVELKDKAALYDKLKTLPDKTEYKDKKVSWSKESQKAEEDGKSKVTNNDFMLNDEAYKKLKASVEDDRKIVKNANLLNSNEFNDYELYLDTCKDLGVKPYIILMPTNGRWYDYLGLTKDKRDAFFDKAQKIAEEKGFEVLNLKNQEYEPYFMYDAVHLGWKGWLKVDEELYKHFKEK
ncbi:D-alanyl-lipoteichoic acid biosynthesis protein DltD [Clostridium sp. YIM B02500]|uniref:D-alanyl-lipoteichoic acid biosynthesis protein DltD n=1 Tax=Clostridium sp. YIM B02500 TaxID=2910681 RepID=UPI001EED08AC|nr:D-alanyl-lipoteichoic acid biosynthesis protein DltD [Clostridium sp. YIM B02500]